MGDHLSSPGFGVSQYYDESGLFQRLDPRMRLIAVLMLLGTITATASLWGLGCGLFFVLVLLYLSKSPLHLVLRRMVRPLLFILVLIVLQILFSPADSDFPDLFQWKVIHINAAGIMKALKLLLRFSTLFLLLNWMTAVLSSTEIVRALAMLLRPFDHAGIPTHDVVLLVQVALHFLPLFSAEVERIAKAQASRGAAWGTAQGGLMYRIRQIMPVLLPLFITSLRRVENLAQAIEARGYGAGPRTSMVVLHYRNWDGVAGSVIAVVGLLILFL